MIHSPGPMPTGNFDQEVTPGTPPPPARAFRFPAEYYSAPVGDLTRVVPQWVPLGCGSLSAVILVTLFAAGAFITGSKMGELVDLMLGTTLGELRTMYTPEVTAPQKETFESAVKKMRDGVRAQKVPVQDVQPFLKSLQGAISDKKVTPAELETLTASARTAAAAPSKKAKPAKQPK